MQRCVQQCALVDMRWQGVHFTWSNKQQVERMVYIKIDRVMVNDEWLKHFPDAFTWFQTAIFLDHALALVHLARVDNQKKSSFKYNNMWALSSHFSDIVTRIWKVTMFGDPMHKVMYRLKLLKQPLLTLHKQQFLDILQQLEEVRCVVSRVQGDLRCGMWNPTLITAKKEALRHYQFISSAAHTYMVQKSKAT